jgi:hypothetical protein
MFTQIAGLA